MNPVHLKSNLILFWCKNGNGDWQILAEQQAPLSLDLQYTTEILLLFLVGFQVVPTVLRLHV